MDEADLAQHQIDSFLNASLLKQKNDASKSVSTWPYGKGRCKNCGDLIDDERPYCEEACRDDHWERIKMNSRKGNR